MSLPSDAISTLMSGDPELVLKAILKAHPDRATDVLDVVARLGLEDAIRVILGRQQQRPTPGSAQSPGIPATGSSPLVGKAIRGISSAVSGMPHATRKPAETGAGSAGQLGVTTSNVDTPRPEDTIVSPEIPVTSGGRQSVAPIIPEETVNPMLAPITLFDPLESPAPTKESYDDFIKEFQVVCEQNKIPMPVALAIIKKESQFNPSAIGDAGELGLMQLLPGTARQVGLQVSTQKDERNEPKKNINAGLKYLRWIQTSYKPTTLDDMLAGYNAGPSRMKGDRWKKIRSTVDYVETIKRSINTYEKDPESMLEDLRRLHSVIGK